MDTVAERLPNATCVVDDAIHYLQTTSLRFDTVVDKGLMDVFLCGDDWDRTIQPLVQYVTNCTADRFVLVSYRLPRSTREFIQSACPSLDWNFHVDGSTDGRSTISVAARRACG